MKRGQLDQGQWVHWFRFNKTGTTQQQPIYDTGPARAWYPPIKMPVWLGEYHRAAQNYDDDGLYLVDRLHVICSWWAFFSTTMPDPDPYGQDHLNDRCAFDGHLFNVDSFIPRGRAASYFLTISVDLVEVAQTDLAEDGVADQFTPYLVVDDISGGVI
jgi:hypothetical protein